MLWASPNGGKTKAERPAIRHSKLPVAEPEAPKCTFMATCEIEAVPLPESRRPPAASVNCVEAASKTAESAAMRRTVFTIAPPPWKGLGQLFLLLRKRAREPPPKQRLPKLQAS